MATSAVERVTGICDHYDNGRELQIAVLEELVKNVAFDAHAWVLTDPETEVGSAPVADVPCLAELPRLIRLKYLTAVNRWTTMNDPVATLRTATNDRPERSRMWRELLADYDVHDVMSLVFRDGFGCWGFLDLWRIGSGSAFDVAEAALLRRAVHPITDALRRCQAHTFRQGGSLPERTGPVVLLLSPDLDVKAQTPQTDLYLATLVPPDGDRRPIPAAAYNVAAQLIAVESGIDHHPARTRLHLAGGIWLTVTASRIGNAVPIERRDIAVSIEISSPAERSGVFVRAHGLTSRESELVGHLAAGSDTRRIASAMYISENTVQDHLKSVFAKTGVRNRRALLARAVGS